MHYTKIIFERLTPIHLPILSYYLWKQKEIRFFDNLNYAKRKKWVKKLVREGKISEIPPVEIMYDKEAYGIAMDNVDKFYKYFTGNSVLAREMTKIYEDENIELAYKKGLARELSTFYYINSYLHHEESELEDGERILFIPHQYGKYLELAKKCGVSYQHHKKVDIAYDSRMFSLVYDFSQKAKDWLLQFGTIAFYFGILVIPWKDNRWIKEYTYAILITNPDYQFKFKTRSVDFLLGGNIVTKDNTIFILLSPAISKDNLDEIRSKDLNVMDCSWRFIPSTGFSSKAIIYLLKRILSYVIKHTFLGLFENNIILEVNKILLSVFFKWSFILQKIKIKHLVTFNDEGIDHIGRNILLNRTGAKTWYYAHSASMGYIATSPDSDIRNSRHWLWSFLYYDYYVSWNNEMIEYYKLHPQKINNYLSIGCIWSQSIVDILEGRIIPNLGKKIFTDFDRDRHKTLAFFDHGYVPNLVSPLEDGVTFYRCILRLLEELPDILVIIKEKKSEETVLDLYEKFGGNSDIFYEHYKPTLDELRKNPRCYVTGYKGDPSEVIAMSDLTITHAFSSPTVEALCARKKAIFFDPSNRWRGYYYDKIPNLIAHNYDELKKLIHYWLHEVTDKDFEDFLNTYVKGEIDPYLDGKALSRFRKLLGE